MLDETVETRRPWRGSPRPCVHAGVFLRFMGIISTVSRQLRYALTREHTPPLHTETRDLRPLRCGKIVACVHRSSSGAYALFFVKYRYDVY